MGTIQIHPLSLAVGAIAVSAAFVLSAQTTAPAQTTWPPPKAMIVNLLQDASLGMPVTTVPPGGRTTILTVPADRWLTITSAQVSFTQNSFVWLEFNPATGVSTPKGFEFPSLGGLSGPIGWTFAPGSEVVLEPAPVSPPTSSTLTGVRVLGYYSRN